MRIEGRIIVSIHLFRPPRAFECDGTILINSDGLLHNLTDNTLASFTDLCRLHRDLTNL
jgi:hypothetical protein